MRDQTRVVIGFGSIWGLFALGALILGAITFGASDSALEAIALTLYGLTILPACILSIWFRKSAGSWLIVLSLITAVALTHKELAQIANDLPKRSMVSELLTDFVVAAIPAALGLLLVRREPK